MNASTFHSHTIGKMAIATGLIGVSTLIFGLIFTFAGDVVPIFYRLNDLFNLIMALMSGALVWMLYSRFREKMTSIHRILLFLVLVGMILAVIGFRLIAFGHTGWVLSGWYTDTAYALIGLWVIGLNFTALQNGLLPKGFSLFGVVVGAVMALGFVALPGLIRNIDSADFMSPILYGIWNMSIQGWIFLYPIWCILLGRWIL
jgi:hypothetical protein